MHHCIALQSKSNADILAYKWHVFALLLNTILIMSINVSCGCIWDSKLSGSCLEISLSFGPAGQFSGPDIQTSHFTVWLLPAEPQVIYGNTEWGGNSNEMSVAGWLGPWCPLSSFSLKNILLDLWVDKCAFMRCFPTVACVFLSIHMRRWWGVMVAYRRKSLCMWKN